MLLERLPYLATILRRSRMPSPSTAATIREIQKITSFHGAGGGKGNAEDDGEEMLEQQGGNQEQWATDKDVPATPRKKKGVRFVGSKTDEQESAIAGLAAEGASLVLEDDDIED